MHLRILNLTSLWLRFPTYGIQNFDQPKALLDRWDEIMDIFQVLHGRPFERARAEAYLLDASQFVVGSFPGGYPVTPGFYAEVDGDITKGYYSPFAALNEGTWEEDAGLSVMLHELGHHHYGRYLGEGGQETFVNVPAAAVFTDIYGMSYDDALRYSGYQFFDRTDAAIDWMVTDNFRAGNIIGIDLTVDPPTGQLAYQARGHAKYLDLADISGGWHGVGKVFEAYYLEDLASGSIPETQSQVEYDDFLRKGSNALQCNLASLFHFWGIQPSPDVEVELAIYQPCDGALERVTQYLDNAPRTNAELQAYYDEKVTVHSNQLFADIYALLLEKFDASYAQQIRDTGADILTRYFSIEADGEPSQPVIATTEVDLTTNTNSNIEFSWSESR